MVVLTISNSECNLIGLSVPQFKSLRDVLSYTSDNYHNGRPPTKCYLVNTKGVFATGLLHRVSNWLLETSIIFDVKDLRIAPKASRLRFKGVLSLPPYPDQENVVAACSSSIRGTVSACTGFGKSYTMAMLIQALQLKTLIIVPNVGLRTQLRESMAKIFGSLDNITIENIDSPKLKNCKDYGLLIIDEAHHVAAKTYRKLNKMAWGGIYRRFFFTATPFRSKDEEQLLFESIAGQVIYEVDYHKAVANRYIVPVEAFYLEVPRTKIKGNQKSWPAMYSELVVHNEPKNQIISNLLSTFAHNKVPTLCLVKEVLHGKNIVKQTNLPFIHGDAEDARITLLEFLLQEKPALIGTVGVLGEGVDTKPAEIIIIAGLGKSKNQLMQCIGRGVRNYPGKTSCKVILIYDPSHQWTRKHYREQCKILLDMYGVVPVKLEI